MNEWCLDIDELSEVRVQEYCEESGEAVEKQVHEGHHDKVAGEAGGEDL